MCLGQGRGDGIGKTRRGKGVKILAIVDRHGLPLSVSTHAANHHEVTLVQLSFDCYMLEAKPEHLIGDRAYDSDGLDDDLQQDGVNMIALHRSTRKLKTQDGRRLRRYQRRWLVERFFAWLHMVTMEAPLADSLGILTPLTSWGFVQLRPSPCCLSDLEIVSNRNLRLFLA